MRWWSWVMVAGAAALLCSGCGDGDAHGARRGGDVAATAARATVEAAATAGLLPEGLVVSTPTPDLHAANELSPAELRARLSQDAKLGRLFDAVEARDVDGTLAEFDWQLAGCGGRLTAPCPPGVAAGTPLRSIRAGTDASASEATVRELLERLLPSAGAGPAVILQSQVEPAQYVLAYRAVGDVAMPSTFGDPSTSVGAMLFYVDARAAHAVQTFSLSEAFTSAREFALMLAGDSGYDLLPLLFVEG
ncbi:MAG TPA: hypothetical protein VFC53_06665 [Dehalococcoidia bacterium]|nr:hypothetical protein [Dehalococcoidia bacterium]